MPELWDRVNAAAPAQEPINMWTTPSRQSDERQTQTPSMWEALMQAAPGAVAVALAAASDVAGEVRLNGSPWRPR
jgi:hypothetical protein